MSAWRSSSADSARTSSRRGPTVREGGSRCLRGNSGLAGVRPWKHSEVARWPHMRRTWRRCLAPYGAKVPRPVFTRTLPVPGRVLQARHRWGQCHLVHRVPEADELHPAEAARCGQVARRQQIECVHDVDQQHLQQGRRRAARRPQIDMQWV
eukprot:6291810-Prymnesium_polylepis.2